MGTTTSKLFFESCRNLNLANIIDINGIIHCASNLKGLASDSASPSDILLFDFYKGSQYNGEPISKGFQKLFISNIDDLSSTFNNIPALQQTHALLYEYLIYMYKIRPLTELSVNPHFVKVLGGKLDISTNKMGLYILEKAFNYSQLNNFEQQKLYNFLSNRMFHNLLCMMLYDPSIKRLSITDQHNQYDKKMLLYDSKKQQLLNTVKYGFILTEGIDYNNNIKSYSDYINMEIGESIKLVDFLQNVFKNNYETNTRVKDEMFRLYFQLLTACYALFLSGVNHNDLHSANVWIKRVPNCLNSYLINDKTYKLDVTHTVLIYDFDRAYLFNYENLLNNGINPALNNINNKDILQLFSYIYYINQTCRETTVSKDLFNLRELIRNTVMIKPSTGTPDYNELTRILGDCNNPKRDTHITYRLNIPDNMFNSLDIMLDKWYNSNASIMYTRTNYQNKYVYVCNKNSFKLHNINTQEIFKDIINIQESNCTKKSDCSNEIEKCSNIINEKTKNCNNEKDLISKVFSQQYDSLRHEKENLQGENNSLKQNITRLNEEYKSHVQKIEKECVSTANQHFSSVIEPLKSENESLKKQVNYLKKQLEKYNDNRMND